MANREEDTPLETPASGSGVPLEAIPLHSTNLLTVLDERGIVRYESPAIERVFGYDQDELLGEQVAEYFHPDDRERVVGAFRNVVASEEHLVEAVEYRHERADGTYCWVESVTSTDTTPEGHYVVNTRDVSDRKRQERELERKTERLDRFASVVAHDLRNPLNVAQGHLNQIRTERDCDDLEAVTRAHDRMETLTADLLALAREGDGTLTMEPVDLADTVERCWETVATAGGSLVVDTDLTVRADEGHLRQLLENVIRNAIDHGGDDVTVSVGELPAEAGFYVEDDGTGIPSEEADRLFDRGHTSATEGAGYGLAIVRTVAEAHGWTVTASEGRDGGARFEIRGVESTH